MDIISFLLQFNRLIDLPFTLLFLVVGVFLTFFTRFPQFRAFKHFIHLLTDGLRRTDQQNIKTIDAFHALCTAMATSIGIGNVVGPSLAIVVGGPGALFWLLIYAFFGSVTKLVEVTFAIKFRQKTQEGNILGGPAQYLRLVHPWLATWYGAATIILFAGWSGIQSKALAEILSQQAIPEWITGLCLAIFVLIILLGGATRVGAWASKLVPLMFGMYVIFGLLILLSDIPTLLTAVKLILSHIFYPAAPLGGFLGATIFVALREGIYKGVFITESGMGTSAIAHSMSDAKRPIDQGILAMFSVAADTFLCLLSGLLVLTSGVWLSGIFTNTLVLQVFRTHFAQFGSCIFIISIALFIITTAIGNSFNGGQSFAILSKYRWMVGYYIFVAVIIFISSISHVPLIWAVMDIIFPFVALPNLIGIVILSLRHPEVLRYK